MEKRKNAIVFGTTGLTGHYLIQKLSVDNRFNEVYSSSRKVPSDLPGNVKHIALPDENVDIPDGIDVAFCAIGTTIKKAGSQDAFEKIDLKLVEKIAQQCYGAGISKFVLVSSVGADATSKNFYLRTKGRLEQRLASIGFPCLLIFRPSLLLGKRKESRFLEDLAQFVLPLVTFVFKGKLTKYKPIQVPILAEKMIDSSISFDKDNIFEGNAIYQLAK